jgi:GNAT superfamily N-acetyltransferase
LSPAALELVFESLPGEIRAAHVESLLAAAKPKVLDGLFVMLAGERVVAALFVEFQPGQIANFWGPRVTAGCSDDHSRVVAALIESGCSLARRNQIELAQTSLAEDTIEVSRHYRDAGFAIRAELEYLIAHVQSVPLNANDGNLQFAPCLATDDELLARLIARTYEGTHDCPELNGVRNMQSVIEGYADAGDSHRRHWFFARRGESEVGVLLIADHAAQNQAELVYMGVLPEFRGRGYGNALTDFAIQRTRMLGHSRLILAVDTRNKPALDLYARAGFFRWDRRIVLINPFSREAY